MRRIDQTFLTLAATCLVVGVCIGIAMGRPTTSSTCRCTCT